MSIIKYSVIEVNKEVQVLTVGGPESDIPGFSSSAIMNAVDIIKQRGGGTVRLSEGTFYIVAPLHLYDNIVLTGMGNKTILRKVDGIKTSFVVDADYGELMVEAQDASGFRKGMGIQIYDSKQNKGMNVTTAVITAIEHNTIFFDNYLKRCYHADDEGTVSNSCSIIQGVSVQNVKISNLVIDGNKEKNEFINGCRGGAIYFFKSRNCLVENVEVFNFAGDGISWQITEDITVRNSKVYKCTNYGMHPGTGTLRTEVSGCDIYDNLSDGIFVCYRVKFGIFQNNRIYNNGLNGINIGHKDTDNTFDNNHIFENYFSGIYMRHETELNGAHRNIYRRNKIKNNGNCEKGYGILIDSIVEDIVIEENEISDSGRNIQKVGIMVNCLAPGLKLYNNKILKHSEGEYINPFSLH